MRIVGTMGIRETPFVTLDSFSKLLPRAFETQ